MYSSLATERQTASKPRRGNAAYCSHAPEAAEETAAEAARGDTEAAVIAEANARRLLALSAAAGGAVQATINW